MKIEFETDINGYQEVRKFKLLIGSILKQGQLDASLHSLTASIRAPLEKFLVTP